MGFSLQLPCCSGKIVELLENMSQNLLQGPRFAVKFLSKFPRQLDLLATNYSCCAAKQEEYGTYKNILANLAPEILTQDKLPHLSQHIRNSVLFAQPDDDERGKYSVLFSAHALGKSEVMI